MWIYRQLKGDYKASILVNTFWILLILSLLVFAFAWRMSLELKVSDYFLSRLKDFYATKAGVMRAIEIIRKDPTPTYDTLDETWTESPEKFKGIDVGDATFTINSLIDEDRKIYLNCEVAKLILLLDNLQKALTRLYPDKEILTSEIIGSIIDWRDSDDEKLWSDPSEREPVPSRNEKFQVLEELMLLKGIAGDNAKNKFQQLKQYFSIYGDGKININTAGKEILTAYVFILHSFLEGRIPEGILLAAVEEILKRQKDNPFKNLREVLLLEPIQGFLEPLEPVDRERVEEKIMHVLSHWLKTTSNTFQVDVEARIKKTIKKKATVVFERQGRILYWYED